MFNINLNEVPVICPVCCIETIPIQGQKVICQNCKCDLTDILILKVKAVELCNAANKKRIQGEYIEAILLLMDAISIDSSLSEAKILLAILYQHLNLRERASAMFTSLKEAKKYSSLISLLQED